MNERSEFMQVTGDRYQAMRKRFTCLPITVEQYRDWVLHILGPSGATFCFYCNRPINLQTMQADHRLPPSRGGSLGLENLAPCCEPCNMQKGALTAEAFIFLRELVNDPYKFSEKDRSSVLGRLQIATRFINGQRIRRGRELQKLGVHIDVC